MSLEREKLIHRTGWISRQQVRSPNEQKCRRRGAITSDNKNIDSATRCWRVFCRGLTCGVHGVRVVLIVALVKLQSEWDSGGREGRGRGSVIIKA